MASVMRSFRLPAELNERVKAAAGDDFSGWARAAFEAHLGESGVKPVGGVSSPARSANAHVQEREREFARREALLRAAKRAS